MGLRPEAFCKISTDEDGKIKIKSLKEKYYEYKSKGKKCFAVIATAGTTVRGAVDPIKEISDFCESDRLWLHIDASIGGASDRKYSEKIQIFHRCCC